MSLDAAILSAHAAGDRAALVDLYARAAETSTGAAVGFFLTQAWVFALDAGDARAEELRARLSEMGLA